MVSPPEGHGDAPSRLLPMGDRAVLVEVDTLDDVLALHARLAASAPPGVIDIVPAARTVLVHVDPTVLPLAAARSWIAHAPAVAAARADAGDMVVPVTYDGPDLVETAGLLGMTADELVRRHRDARWTVAFTGFAPGFGYLVSEDWPFDVPRLDTPRTRVPAGSVGLAAEFTGAYPRATPGGWRLIATTGVPLFDPESAVPALLAPGMRVRFAERASPASAPAAPPAASAISSRVHRVAENASNGRTLGDQVHSRGRGDEGPAPAVEVVEPGLLLTVQDLGRAGQTSRGIAQSGALDRGALRTANRLLGNDEGAAALEVTMGGCRLRALRDLTVVVTGAWGSIRLGGREVDPYTPIAWAAGTELHLDWFARGARAYVGIRGGVDAAPVAGSRATDVLAGLGPSPLRAGDVIAVGVGPAAPVPPLDLHPWGPPDDTIELDLAPGARAGWFAASALDALYASTWTVSSAADRIGIRLDGPALDRIVGEELPSEGMVPGALQVPPSGRPTILGPDGPVTGGYPVIAVVTDATRDRLAQARPGTGIRFRHARPAP